MSFGGGSGGASILDLQSGALSKDDAFVNIYKIPEAKGFLNANALNAYRVSVSRVFATFLLEKKSIRLYPIRLKFNTLMFVCTFFVFR